jgi:hypothetical protein
VIRIRPDDWSATVEQLHRCGADRECVVYWCADISAPDLVTSVVHPIHRSTANCYEIDDEWLTRFWMRLYHERLLIRAQVHTHCGAAFHSRTDDAWPIVHTDGFLSLVIPRFARPPVRTDELYLAELMHGSWRTRSAGASIEGLR